MFSVGAFNEQIAERLRPWLPDSMEMSADAHGVTVEDADGHAVTWFVSDLFLRAPHEEALVVAARTILDGVQAFVTEHLAERWPPVQQADDERAAESGARVEAGVLNLWYGDLQAGALFLAPLPLSAQELELHLLPPAR